MQGSNARWLDRIARPPLHTADKAPDAFAELYAERAAQLRQIVRCSVRAPDAVIDDACQIAWSRLLRRWESVRDEAALPWLVRTASRAALRSLQRSARELSLDELCDAGCDSTPVALLPPSRTRSPSCARAWTSFARFPNGSSASSGCRGSG